MTTFVHLRYLAGFFVEWEIFQKKKIRRKS